MQIEHHTHHQMRLRARGRATNPKPGIPLSRMFSTASMYDTEVLAALRKPETLNPKPFKVKKASRPVP